ncbi:ATP-binding protein [Paenibacillus sp. RRE4]|uniref:ATP-binding protein n=1 Tax=Paenibacillus sp. RRE4 TaxID=2962587 RepID=UPI002880CC8D|nr:ATP-binding protein [Paenibacillus sp. RRE4]MDT0124864.1 ATP-binding protein [Paenibacillus sp. RRE4]
MPLLYYVQTSVIGLIITLIICFHMLRRNKEKSELRSVFLVLLFSNMSLLLLEMVLNMLIGSDAALVGKLLPAVICVFYILNPVPEALWIFYLDAVIRRNKRKGMSRLTAIVICLPIVVNAVLSLGSLSGGYLFYVDADHVYHRGPYFLLMPAMCYIYLFYYLGLVILKRKHVSVQEFRALLFAALPPLVAGALQSMFFGLSVLWIALAFSLLIVYLNLQSEQVYKELIKLNRLKDQFLANTSHELRTPLNGIINITNSILEDRAGAEDTSQRHNLKTVLSEARRLDRLIHDILDISSMRSGGMKLTLRSIDLHSIADASLYVISQLNDGKPIEFINQIPTDFPAVYADEERLYQIFYNLVGNALKFTQHGHIRTGAVLKQDHVEIWVQDTGMGIPNDRLEDIFNPFYQLDSTETREAGGTGLGLSITQTLIELHGGTIWVKSRQGEGSIFLFTLPISNERKEKVYGKQPDVQATLIAEKHVLTTKRVKTEKGKSYAILAVDDDPASLAALFHVLDNDGYDVTAVSDGMAALAKLEQSPTYDLVILDVMMPKISGYDVLRTIRQRFQPLDLPVLMVTARARPEDLQIGFEAGANDYLTKPFESLELKSRVKTLVQLKESVGNRISAELSFLQAQIKPHFLFNSLSTIAALSTVDPMRAKGLLYDLSDYLRGSFSFESGEEFTSIGSELATVRAYVSIEQERFQDRLDMQYDIDERVELKIPMLIIQPLVENAIRHGIMTRNAGGVVRLTVRREEDTALIIVEDNGVGMEPKRVQQLLGQPAARSGVGLMNIQRRMILHYGTGIQIRSRPNEGTTIILQIPWNKENSTDDNESHIAG